MIDAGPTGYARGRRGKPVSAEASECHALHDQAHGIEHEIRNPAARNAPVGEGHAEIASRKQKRSRTNGKMDGARRVRCKPCRDLAAGVSCPDDNDAATGERRRRCEFGGMQHLAAKSAPVPARGSGAAPDLDPSRPPAPGRSGYRLKFRPAMRRRPARPFAPRHRIGHRVRCGWHSAPDRQHRHGHPARFRTWPPWCIRAGWTWSGRYSGASRHSGDASCLRARPRAPGRSRRARPFPELAQRPGPPFPHQ